MKVVTNRRTFLGIVASALAWFFTPALAQNNEPDRSRRRDPRTGRRRSADDYVLPPELATFSFLSLVLGRVSDRSVTVSALAKETMEGYFEYGTTSGKYDRKTNLLALPAGQPVELAFDNIQSNTEYFYRLQYRQPGEAVFHTRPECRFHTQRAAGSTFMFAIQGDSHPERPQMNGPDLYARTLLNAASAKPDFYICMGDDFSVDTLQTVNADTVAERYTLQRPFLGLVAQSAPLFLLNGNHEQASLFNFNQYGLWPATRSRRKAVMSKAMISCPALFCAFALPGLGAPERDAKPDNGHGHRAQGETNYFNVAVPAHAFDLILARPEKNSVTLSVLAYQDLEGFLVYGTNSGACTNQTPVGQFKNGAPVELVIGALQANTRYYYQFRSRPPGSGPFTNSQEYTFQTARSPGSGFTFTLTADAHLDEHTSPDVYLQTLANIRTDHPDFHIDLGNLFMTDKHASRNEAARQYLAQRNYLGQIGSSVPIFLALGTHDGESSKYDDGSDNCLAVWSNLIRKRYFPNPVPDNFYNGNNLPQSHCGLLQNYYAWEWGDALFVVLDPFRYSIRQRGSGDGWSWSLGQAQYRWLEQTLEHSRAKFKFVFIHNLLCGDQAARGGVEVASLNEWGGKNTDGNDGFQVHRPGRDMPVHQLLVRNHVTAVFKAHDNFYARQELDGILYLMVPQPSFAGDDRIRDLQNYGYKQGTFLGNSGHVRVTVSPEKVTVDYVKSSPSLPVADSHVIPAR
jgi:hypothetical protein